MLCLRRMNISGRVFSHNQLLSCLFTETYMRTGPSLKAAPPFPSSTWINPFLTSTLSAEARTLWSMSSSTKNSQRKASTWTAVCEWNLPFWTLEVSRSLDSWSISLWGWTFLPGEQRLSLISVGPLCLALALPYLLALCFLNLSLKAFFWSV